VPRRAAPAGGDPTDPGTEGLAGLQAQGDLDLHLERVAGLGHVHGRLEVLAAGRDGQVGVAEAGAGQRERGPVDVIHFHCDYLHFPWSRRHPCPRLTTLQGRPGGKTTHLRADA
jgi:hypothetical protein